MATTATLATLVELKAAGKTAEEAEAALTADPRFALVVDRNAIRHLLSVHPTLLIRMQDMLGETLVPDPETNLLLRGGLVRVLNTALWDTGILELTAAEYAVEYRTLLGVFQSLGKLTEPEVQAFLDLGGGSLVERLTAAEIAEQWAWMDAVAAAETAEAQVRDAAEAAISVQQNRSAQAAVLLGEVRGGNLAALADLQALAEG